MASEAGVAALIAACKTVIPYHPHRALSDESRWATHSVALGTPECCLGTDVVSTKTWLRAVGFTVLLALAATAAWQARLLAQQDRVATRLKGIAVGMTKEDVLRLMESPPISTSTVEIDGEGYERWSYFAHPVAAQAPMCFFSRRSNRVVFVMVDEHHSIGESPFRTKKRPL